MTDDAMPVEPLLEDEAISGSVLQEVRQQKLKGYGTRRIQGKGPEVPLEGSGGE
ncbi:MAG: hypothetical protein JSS68_13970 [Actinobacteria bacterium]|nr:hypothetical protein [Actinomycetota bacterium]